MRLAFIGAIGLILAEAPARSSDSPATQARAASDPAAIALDTGGVPQGAASEIWFDLAGKRVVRNVTKATLTPVLPGKGKANGAAVIVAPGGGFVMLSMDSEGFDIARWLAERGVAAFVLKYRVKPTPVEVADFWKSFASAPRTPKVMDETYLHGVTPAYAVDDGLAAVKLVRAHAAEWGVDPKRLGMIGFSAGAITTVQVAQRSTPETMPAFIGPIYGPMVAMTVPRSAPPLFASLAFDDPIFGKTGFGLAQAWQAADKPVEVHVYQAGGHGYGPGKPGTTTTGWLDAFYHWLGANNFLKGGK